MEDEEVAGQPSEWFVLKEQAGVLVQKSALTCFQLEIANGVGRAQHWQQALKYMAQLRETLDRLEPVLALKLRERYPEVAKKTRLPQPSPNGPPPA